MGKLTYTPTIEYDDDDEIVVRHVVEGWEVGENGVKFFRRVGCSGNSVGNSVSKVGGGGERERQGRGLMPKDDVFFVVVFARMMILRAKKMRN